MPEFAAEPVKRQPRQLRSARKLNRQLALKQAQDGLSNYEIAKEQNVAPVTVWRYLCALLPPRKIIDDYRSKRADILTILHSKAMSVKAKIIESFDAEAVINEMSVNERVNLLHAVNVSGGTDYDKERLERGQSTSNLGVLGKVIHEVHQVGVHKRIGGKNPKHENSENGYQNDGSPTPAQVSEVVHSEN